MSSFHAQNTNEDLYSILGVSSKATETDIRKAYLKKARELHPDKQPPTVDRTKANEAFTQLSNAYEILYDEKKRKRYDYMKKYGTSSSSTNGPAYNTRSSRRTKSTWYGNNDTNTNQDTGSTRSGRTRTGSNQRQRTSSSSRHRPNSTNYQHQSSSSHHYYSNYNDPHGSSHAQYSSRYYHDEKKTKSSPKYSYPSSSTNGSGTSQDHRNKKNKSTGQNSSSQYNYSEGKSKSSHSNSADTPNYGTESQQRKSYGIKANGDPCKNCIKQGKYCWQHAYQEELHKSNNKNHDSHNNAFSNANHCKSSSSSKTKTKTNRSTSDSNREEARKYYARNYHQTFGVKRNGEPCLNCMKQGRYCWQHADQDPLQQQQQNKQQDSHYDHGYTSSKRIYGVTQKGQACKRCIAQGGYCYQHVHQEAVHSGSSDFPRQ